jgi:hypothetical protein
MSETKFHTHTERISHAGKQAGDKHSSASNRLHGVTAHKISAFVPTDERSSNTTIPVNKPWSPTGLWDVEAPTFSSQSAHRWRWGYSLARRPPFTPTKIPGTHFCQRLSRPQGHIAAGRVKSTEKSNGLIVNRTRDLPACSIANVRFSSFVWFEDFSSLERNGV